MIRSKDGRSATPLLHKKDDDLDERGRSRSSPYHSRTPSGARNRSLTSSLRHSVSPLPSPSVSSTHDIHPPLWPTLSRRSTMRSRSPVTNARMAARQRYTYAAFFLVISLVSFTVQTELAAYVQRHGWNKAYAMLYLTHGSWSLLWPAQLLVLRLRRRDVPWPVFWRRHVWLLHTTAQMVQHHDLNASSVSPHHRRTWEGAEGGRGAGSPSTIRYLVHTTAFITTSLTIAGLSWYLAVNMTSPSDLTAIYNCSAFFAYAFSVPLLKEKLRLGKSLAVIVAIGGVLIVAYGDTKEGRRREGSNPPSDEQDQDPGTRFLGNLIIGAGSVLYGLYEVLYKRFACPPEGCSPGRGMIFANAFGSLIGCFTLLVLWIPLPILHITGIETFALPTGRVAWMLLLSVVMNATFAGSFLVLISLTSPVLSSVAALLTIFIVALSDWFITGEPPSAAALAGGCMIITAFAVLSWSSYREMVETDEEKAAAQPVDLSDSAEDDDEEGDESDKDHSDHARDV